MNFEIQKKMVVELIKSNLIAILFCQLDVVQQKLFYVFDRPIIHDNNKKEDKLNVKKFISSH